MKLPLSSAKSITASAPASLMLAGEHAVLYGYPAIVCAINQRLTVTLTPREDQIFTLRSPRLGDYQNTLDEIKIIAPFQYVTALIQNLRPQISSGFDLHIISDFSHTIGFGSSAAVTVATLAVFSRWLQLGLSLEQLYQQSFTIIHEVQQVGSGADVAASVFGGVGFYQRKPFAYEKLEHFPPLAVLYSGSKEPTPQVVKKVQQRREQDPERYQQLFEQISSCTYDMRQAINQEHWVELGRLCNQHYELQEALGVSNVHINNLIQMLQKQPNIYGSKISGAGLGDCIIGIGELAINTFPLNEQQKQQGIQQIEVEISSQGVRYE